MHFQPSIIEKTPSNTILELNKSQQFVNSIKRSKIDELLRDIWLVIFTKGSFKDLYNYSLVDKKWNQLTNDPLLLKKMIFEGFCFNPTHWNKFYGLNTVSNGEISKAYAKLPSNINDILKSNCPVFRNKKIIDTHLLVWIPETIKEKPVTIVNFGNLLKEQPKFSTNSTGYRHVWKEIITHEGDKPIESGWRLMTKELIGNSREQCYATQKELVERLSMNSQTSYRVPKVGEALICVYGEYFRSNKPTLGNFPSTYTHCEENILSFQIILGCFSEKGMYTDYFVGKAYAVGVVALRKL